MRRGRWRGWGEAQVVMVGHHAAGTCCEFISRKCRVCKSEQVRLQWDWDEAGAANLLQPQPQGFISSILAQH